LRTKRHSKKAHFNIINNKNTSSNYKKKLKTVLLLLHEKARHYDQFENKERIEAIQASSFGFHK